MSLTQQIFQYCERGKNPEFWGEPVNAVTNLAFILAALVAFNLARKQPAKACGAYHYMLIAIVFVIGIGSGLFHTFATRWAVMADVFPIIVFIITYLGFAAYRFIGFNLITTVIALALFLVFHFGINLIRCDGGPCLNGTIGYVPALLALIAIAVVLYLKKHPAALSFIGASVTFTISATFRTFDKAYCDLTKVGEHAIGTHFMWHILNALTLYILLRAAIKYGHNATQKATSS